MSINLQPDLFNQEIVQEKDGKEIYDRKFTQSGRDFILKLFESESK